MEWTKALPLLTALLVLSLSASPQEERAPQIKWLTDYHEAIRLAKEADKPVLVDFYAAWCGPCRMMDEQTFVDPEVIQVMKDYVNVKVNIDADEKTALAYGVRSIPRTVVLNIHGEMVGDRVGFMGSEDYLDYLKDVEEYLRKKVDGTVIMVPESAPATVELAADATLESVMAVLASPDPKVRERAQEAVLALDAAVVKAWMREGLESPWLGERIAAKEVLAALEPEAVEDYDPWAREPARVHGGSE